MKFRYTFIFILVIVFVFNIITYSQANNDSIKVYTLEETVVTGTRVEMSKSKIPSSISIVNREVIEKNPELNILNHISGQIPGLFINERSIAGFGVGTTASGTISIRGIGGKPNSQVLVLIDGQPQFMGLFGHPINDLYLSSDIERVEVIRGPASLLYGSNAAGGAINLITRKSKKEGLSFHSSLSYGSFNTSGINGTASYQKSDLSLIASLNYLNTDGHRNDGDDKFKSLSGFIKTTLILGEHFNSSLDANITDSKFYDPGTESTPRKNNYYNYLRGRTALSIDNFFNGVEGALKLYYSFGKHDFFDGWHSDDNVKGITFYQNIKFYSSNIITLGIDYKNYGGKGVNNNVPPPANKGLNKNYSVNETDVYGIVQYSLTEKLILNAGLRLNNNSKYGWENIPQFGFSYSLNSTTVFKGNIGKAFRSPTIADLFFFPISNEDLKPERIWNYEISISKILLENMRGEVTFFYMEGSNIIQSIPPQKKINSGSFINKGIEALFSYIPHKSMKLNINYTYLHTNKIMPYAPEHQLNIYPELDLNNVDIIAQIKSVLNLYPYGSSNKQNYTLLSLTINTNITRNLQFFVKGENLADVKYYIDEGYPSPGISFMIGLKTNL